MWILLAATPALADGGPHTLTLNNGTSGLSGDCAACHRAHTAQAADLLKAAMPGLCLTCHDGTGSTADVVDGVQFTPATWDHNSGGTPNNPGDPILGALRGGGFSYALIDTGAASRLTYNSRGGILVTLDNAVASPGTSIELTWAAIPASVDWPTFTGFAGGTLTFDPNASASTVQTAVNTRFSTSTDYSLSTSVAYMSGLPTGNANMVVSKSTDGKTFTFAPQNSFRLVVIPTPDLTADTSGQNAKVSNTLQANMGSASHVGVRSTGQAVTSTHEGTGTVWGNGPQGQGNAGATGVALECTSCHNPHGNGMYRILATTPGEDWGATPAPIEASTTLAANVTTGAQTTIEVTSAADFPMQKFIIQVGTEQMQVTGGQGTTTWTVVRGYNGTTPGAPASGTVVSMLISQWTAPTNDVEVVDGPTLTAGQVHNYTVLPSANGLTSGVVGTATQGDYFRYKYDPSGTANFTNFYLVQDPMTTGWNGTSPTNALDVGTASTTLTTALTAASSSTTAVVASLAGMPSDANPLHAQPVFLIKIGSEIMTASRKVSSGAFVANSLTVGRAYFGTTIAAHAIGDAVDVVSSDPTKNATAATYAVLYNKLGRMTAWCITCHTRYDGNRLTTPVVNGSSQASSLGAQTPIDPVFMYKHGTTGTGCEQCHVNHGTNAVMTEPFSSSYLFPDGTAEDSALLKVNNRGTCNLCHEPTHTVTAGQTVGIVPGAITPGP